jgi:hypothetical protein
MKRQQGGGETGEFSKISPLTASLFIFFHNSFRMFRASTATPVK